MGPCGGGRPLQEDEIDESPMPAPKGVAAMWNLDPSYTEQSLRDDLWEVDFDPFLIVPCGKNKGAFVLVFPERYMAAGLATALDGIDPEEKVVRSGMCFNQAPRLLGFAALAAMASSRNTHSHGFEPRAATASGPKGQIDRVMVGSFLTKPTGCPWFSARRGMASSPSTKPCSLASLLERRILEL